MKKMLFCIMIVSLFLCSFSFAKDFDDLDDSHWAYDAVQKMKQDGVINGYEDNTFRPDKKISRGEFAKIFATSLNLLNDDTEDVYFADIDSSHWAYPYAKVLASYINLDEDDEGNYIFNPDGEILREEVAYALANVLCVDAENVDAYLADDFFDSNDIDEEY